MFANVPLSASLTMPLAVHVGVDVGCWGVGVLVGGGVVVGCWGVGVLVGGGVLVG